MADGFAEENELLGKHAQVARKGEVQLWGAGKINLWKELLSFPDWNAQISAPWQPLPQMRYTETGIQMVGVTNKVQRG